MSDIPYRVKHAFASYRKGDIIYPNGLQRDYLRTYGWIESYEGTEAAIAKRKAARETVAAVLAPAPEPDPEPVTVDDIEPDPEDADPLVESAVMPEPETAAMEAPRRGPGRPRKYETS